MKKLKKVITTEVTSYDKILLGLGQGDQELKLLQMKDGRFKAI